MIKNYEYLSIFPKHLNGGNFIFTLNIWCEGNKKFELFNSAELSNTFNLGYQLASALNIDLLDATRRNDYRWIDVQEWTDQIKNEAS